MDETVRRMCETKRKFLSAVGISGEAADRSMQEFLAIVLYRKLIDALNDRHPPTATLLEKGKAQTMNGLSLIVSFNDEAVYDKVSSNAKRIDLVESGLSHLNGKPTKFVPFLVTDGGIVI